MDIQRVFIAALAAAACAVTPALAKSSKSSGQASGKISSEYSSWAGSQANSDALVSGLRGGAPITLSTRDAAGNVNATTFTPSTGRQGYGNVKHSLALAQKNLANVGITQPSAQQMQAALNGGDVRLADGSTTRLKGVTSLRSSGMGWGGIAQEYNTKLGAVEGSGSANAQARAGKGKSK